MNALQKAYARSRMHRALKNWDVSKDTCNTNSFLIPSFLIIRFRNKPMQLQKPAYVLKRTPSVTKSDTPSSVLDRTPISLEMKWGDIHDHTSPN